MSREFVDQSYAAQRYLNPKKFVHNDCVVTHRKNWGRFGDERGGIFFNMKAFFLLEDRETQEVFQRIVYAGGGNWDDSYSIGHLVKKRVDGNALTHIFTDPWILDQADRRYEDFKYWRRYEEWVSERSAECEEGQYPKRWQNGGILHKLHYTFLIDKLLHPLENIRELKYNIFDPKVKSGALRRREIRRKMRVKLERQRVKDEAKEDSDDDLNILKERFEEAKRQRKPGRFYIEKERNHDIICEVEMKTKSDAQFGRNKRKYESSQQDLYHRVGYMESNRRKNRKSAGSYIQANAKQHINQDGNLNVDKLLADHGLAPIQSMQNEYLKTLTMRRLKYENSHPDTHRPGEQSQRWNQVKQEMKREPVKTEKTEVSRSGRVEVTLSDSDDDVVEVVEDHPEKQKPSNFDLPQGIVETTRRDTVDVEEIDLLSDDDEDEQIVEKKPSLSSLTARLKNLPEIVLCSSSDEDEEVLRPTLTGSNLSRDDIAVEDDINAEDDPADETSPASESVQPGETLEVVDVEDDHPEIMETESSDREHSKENHRNIADEIHEEILKLARDDPDHAPPPQQVEPSDEPSQVSSIVVEKETPIEALIQPVDDEQMQTDDGQAETREPAPLQDVVDEPSNKGEDSAADTGAAQQRSSVPLLLDVKSKLIQSLNKSVVDNQVRTNDHLITDHVFIPLTQFDKHGESSARDRPLTNNLNLLQEFNQFTTYDEDHSSFTPRKKTRAPRKKKKKTTDLFEDDLEDASDFTITNTTKLTKLMWILKPTSQTLIHPEIFNILWKHFILNSNPLVETRTELFLNQYFMIILGKRGCNRSALADNILNSLRHVRSRDLFKLFDKNNVQDISEVVAFVEGVFRTADDDTDRQAAASRKLIRILTRVCELDFKVWRYYERNKDTLPIIYYMLGGRFFSSNIVKIAPMMVPQSKSLVAVVAMMTACLDDKERNNSINKGLKTTFAQAVANSLEDLSGDQLYYQLQTLQPNWFALIVGKCLLKDNVDMFKLKHVTKSIKTDNSTEILVKETILGKHLAVTHLAKIMRSAWYHSTTDHDDEKDTFEVFEGFKKLSLTEGRNQDAVMLKSYIRLGLRSQTQDLHHLINIAKGGNDFKDTEGASRAVLFNMLNTEDSHWI